MKENGIVFYTGVSAVVLSAGQIANGVFVTLMQILNVSNVQRVDCFSVHIGVIANVVLTAPFASHNFITEFTNADYQGTNGVVNSPPMATGLELNFFNGPISLKPAATGSLTFTQYVYLQGTGLVAGNTVTTRMTVGLVFDNAGNQRDASQVSTAVMPKKSNFRFEK